MKLDLDNIRIDGGTQSRVELNESVVADYAEILESGETLPPVVVFFDGVDHWLADGFHRYFAHKKIDAVEISADIHDGTRRDAVLFSVGANKGHGLQANRADKRKGAETLLKDAEWAKWSDREIAKKCGLSATTIGAIRSSLSKLDSDKDVERTYTTKHGTTAVMKTASIGVQQHREAAKARHEADIARGGHGSVLPPAPAEVEPEDDGPSAEELAAHAAAEAADRELVAKLLDSDEPLAELAEENKQLKAEIAQLKLARDGFMNRCNEAIALVKARDRQIAKLEKMLKETA